MTSDERNLLQAFLRDLVQTRGALKDAEADAMINQALGSNPDAAYVLVQHAILADQALHAAQAQIAALQDQLRDVAPRPQPTSFLGGGPSPWAQAAQSPPPAGYPPQGPFSPGGGLGSFLRSAGTTAAGVAGGAFLFEGLSGLFGGHGGGFGGGFGGFGGPSVENVTVNEYGGGDNDYGGGFDDNSGGGDDY